MELAKVSLVSSIIAISVALSASAEIIVPENPVNEVLGHVVEVTATHLHDDAKTTLFDGNSANRWIAKPKPDPGTGVIPTVILELDGAIVVNAYRLCGHTGENTMSRHPKWFKMFGSNDGTNWTQIDEQANETGWTKGEQRLYTVDNIAAYRFFKFEVYANNGDSTYTTLGELELFHFEQTDVLEVVSADAQIGSPTPAYGGVKGLKVGDKVTVDCVEKRVNDIDTGDYHTVKGFRIVDYAGKVLKEGTADDLPYEYEHAGHAKIVWTWSSHIDELQARSQCQEDITVPFKAEVNEITGESWVESVNNLFDNNFSNRWRADALQKTGYHNWVQYRFLDGRRIVTAFQLFDSGTYPHTGRFPRDFVFQGSNDGETYDDLLVVKDAGDTRPHPKGTVYSFHNVTPYEYYRLYMTREGTTDWLQLGEMELYTIYQPDTLRVFGAPKCYGHPKPDYGFQENLEGGTAYQLLGPTEEIVVSDDQKSVCVGYALRVNGGEETIVDSTSCTYSHVAGDSAVLTWRFADTYRQRFSVKGGGTVDADENWSSLGATITVTASVGPNGAPFIGWSGDLPEGVDASQPTLTYTVDGPRALVANFSPPLFVSATGSDDNDGSSWEQAFASLARAFASLPVNGSLTVGPGTYAAAGGTLVLPANATLTAPAGPAATVIEAAEDSVGCLLAAGTGEVTGFTFRGATADDGGAAGLRLDGTVVSNCVVESCAATATGASAGGVEMTGSAQLLDSTVTNCTSAGNAGGLLLKGGTVRGCAIVGNTAAKSGGGFAVGGTDPVSMADCTIANNVAKTAYDDSNCGGGGLVLRDVTLERLVVHKNTGGGLFIVRDAILRDSTISNNSTGRGGGIYAKHAIIDRCVISGNTTGGYGGGAFLESGSIRNCLVISNASTTANNGGGGLFCRKDLSLANCTVVGNRAYQGCGILLSDPMPVRNMVVVDNLTLASGATVTNLAPLCTIKAEANSRHVAQGGQAHTSCIGDSTLKDLNANFARNGSIVADPIFVDAANGDYHLRLGSPCVNGGAMLDYTAESLDLDRQARVYNFGKRSSKPDMGCYESPYGVPGLMLLVR